ncbi:thermonuclease family protein [Pelagibacterium limicola]|uniref:thermonuclease family protein n=1 Tax=Pelagibacterium limicola TaxID=2791022 RepID=UPI001FE2B0B5|nr:thermonuclease family protein [Pelagibacterium limicola]
MFRPLLVTVFGLAAATSSPASAQLCDALAPSPVGTVVAVSDGDTFDLDTGLTVRLVGIQAPKLPLGRTDFEAWPLGEEARERIEELALGREVTLHYGGEPRDRHGRALAHVVVEHADGPLWVQAEMLKSGLARVYSFPDNRACLSELYDAERVGRAERAGIWRDPFYAIRDASRPETILERLGQYELVEGRVLNVEVTGSRAWLNFGRYWKEDFTVIIEGGGLRLFQREDFDIKGLENRLIRVRGWIESHDGPRMLVTHPEQIEVLG